MSKINNISFEQVKDFIKNNIWICALLIFDLVLFFSALSLTSASAETEGKIDSLSLQKNQIESSITKLSTINKDYKDLQEFKAAFLKRCINFGKKTAVYKFLNKINDFFPEGSSLNLAIVKSYNVTKNQTLSLDQDLQAFQDDNICVDYSLTFTCLYPQLIQIINDISKSNYFIKLKQVEIKTTNTEGKLSVNLVYTVLGKIRPKGNNDA